MKELLLIEPLTVYQMLGLLGIPSFFAGLVGWLVSDLKAKRMQKNMEKTKEYEEFQALKAGLQALLRAQMIDEYTKWSERGWMPLDVRDSFENVWKRYHDLGANGVMDDIHEKSMALPTVKPKDKT